MKAGTYISRWKGLQELLLVTKTEAAADSFTVCVADPPAAGCILLACRTLLTPLLRCDSRSRYVRPHTTTSCTTTTTARPCVEGAWKTPHPHARRSRIILLAAHGGVPGGVCPGLMPHQETRTLGGKLLQALSRHSSNFGSFSSARANATCVCVQPVPAQIAICEIADPHPLHHGKGVHPATRPCEPCCGLSPPPPGYGRSSGQSNFVVGRHPPSSQADDLQLFIISAQPARNTHTRPQVPRHRRRRGGVGNLGIVQLFLHCPSCEPGSQKGGAWTFRAGSMIHKGDCPTIACGCDVARVR